MKKGPVFSRHLFSAESNYDVGNHELLAVKLALEKWRYWLQGGHSSCGLTISPSCGLTTELMSSMLGSILWSLQLHHHVPPQIQEGQALCPLSPICLWRGPHEPWHLPLFLHGRNSYVRHWGSGQGDPTHPTHPRQGMDRRSRLGCPVPGPLDPSWTPFSSRISIRPILTSLAGHLQAPVDRGDCHGFSQGSCFFPLPCVYLFSPFLVLPVFVSPSPPVWVCLCVSLGMALHSAPPPVWISKRICSSSSHQPAKTTTKSLGEQKFNKKKNLK